MRRLSETDILEVWERGQDRDRHRRALAPLAVAMPERGEEALRALPVGERDRLLLLLRRRTFGPRLPAVATCPECAAENDFQVAVADVLAAGAAAEGERTLRAHGYVIRFRLLDSRDLDAAAEAGDVAAARARLVERAVLEATTDGRTVAAGELPEPVLAALGEALEAHDPLAVIPLAVECERCAHRWLPLLDVPSFVWLELANRAQRVMYDVHELARVYGWSEAETLAVEPARRQFYLELAPPADGRGAG